MNNLQVVLSAEEKLKIKEMELDSLLGIISHINSNSSENDLYRLFRLTIQSGIGSAVSKLALFVQDDNQWFCKVNYGTETDYFLKEFNQEVCGIDKQETLVNKRYDGFEEFETIIPIMHKSTKLAYLLLSKSSKADKIYLDINFVKALCSIVLVAIENKKLARKEQKQKDYKQQLEIASRVQGMLFPKKLPYNAKVKFFATYIPHHSVGGDYYDYIEIDKNRFLFCIADVSGKGIPAALLMSNFQAAIRVLSRYKPDLEYMVRELNQLILQNSDGDHFITAFLGIYDKQKEELQYVNAGHIPPLLATGDKIIALNKGTTVLGGLTHLPFVENGQVTGLKDFSVLCVTDGITEATNPLGEEFDEGLSRFLEESQSLAPKEMHQKLLDSVELFKGGGQLGFSDDITIFSCQVKLSE